MSADIMIYANMAAGRTMPTSLDFLIFLLLLTLLMRESNDNISSSCRLIPPAGRKGRQRALDDVLPLNTCSKSQPATF